ncbi:MAG: glycosyltransferase family 2 protein [Candidatus Sedimenticola sp. (ex Thyasira tokunagai)]
MCDLSIVLPAYNEAGAVGEVVCRIRQRFPDAEILVVDDSSSDATAAEAENAGARVVRHLYNMGNGAAIKTGARHAKGETIVFMDADGQHDDQDIAQLIEQIDEGYELVVGSRTSDSHANIGRNLGNRLLNKFASLMTGRTIPDLTSGFRAVKRDTFRQFIHLLPNGFSYPTTSTMAYFRSGYPVAFVPLRVLPRKGKSKINFFRDGIRFMVVIMKVTTLFSPMRLFFPASLMFFLLGSVRYLYFYWQTGSFSNMAGVMFVTAMLVFLIGLVSEQITALHYGISRSRMNDSSDSR